MPLFLIARIAGRTVAIASREVESVVDIGPVVPVPRADGVVRGLTALRSRVVTVINTCVALGLPASRGETRRAVITVIEGHHYAILVDALEDIVPLDPAPLSSGIALDKGWRIAGRGIVERAGEPILIIALDALVPGSAALAA